MCGKTKSDTTASVLLMIWLWWLHPSAAPLKPKAKRIINQLWVLPVRLMRLQAKSIHLIVSSRLREDNVSHQMPNTGRVRLNEHKPEASELSDPYQSHIHRMCWNPGSTVSALWATGNVWASCNIKGFGTKCLIYQCWGDFCPPKIH